MTKVDYVSCSSCGYEGGNVEIAFVRTVANGDVYACPSCEKETMDVDVDEPEVLDERAITKGAVATTENMRVALLFEIVIRMFRMNGLAIICFNRLGYKDLRSYRTHLTKVLNDLSFPSVNTEEAGEIASILTQFAQPEGGHLGKPDRTLERAFIDNAALLDLEKQLDWQAIEIEELRCELANEKARRGSFLARLNIFAKK